MLLIVELRQLMLLSCLSWRVMTQTMPGNRDADSCLLLRRGYEEDNNTVENVKKRKEKMTVAKRGILNENDKDN